MATKKSQKDERLEKAHAKFIDYKRIFSSEQGKRVLADLIAQHFVMRPTYVRGDPQGTAFNEGQRDVVLRIMTIMGNDPTEFHNKMMESNKHVTENI